MIFVVSRKFDVADSAGFAAISTRNVLRVENRAGEKKVNSSAVGDRGAAIGRVVDFREHKNDQ